MFEVGDKIIGILGGMGPEATAGLYRMIISATPVKKDQDHYRVIIDSNSKIPDRTPAIVGKGESPLPMMLETGRNLEKAGADFIIMPCNTAHFFFDQLQAGLNILILHMIRLSANYSSVNFSSVRKVGLLASDGTLKSGLYDDCYGKEGIEIIVPSNEFQKQVMMAIYKDIKRGDLSSGEVKLRLVAEKLIEDGAEAIICGCTEVSLVLHDGDISVPVIDPMQVLAEKAVSCAGGESI